MESYQKRFLIHGQVLTARMSKKQPVNRTAYMLTQDWVVAFGAFSSKSEMQQAMRVFQSLLIGNEQIGVRAYGNEQIKRTIRAMAAAVKKAASDPGLEFVVRGPGYVKWCIKKVLAGESLCRHVKVEHKSGLVMLNEVPVRERQEEDGGFRIL